MLPTFGFDDAQAKVLRLHLNRYNSNDALAVLAEVEWNDGEIERGNPVSINLDHPDNDRASSRLPSNEFYAKDFDERERLFNALVEAGWIEIVSDKRPRSGFCTYAHCRLTDKAITEGEV